MQTLAQASNSARMQLSTPSMQNSSLTPEPIRPRPLIRQFLDQSYDTFNIFGLTPEQMANRYKAFLTALSGFSDAAVTHAFQVWLANETTMPVPANIAKTASEYDRIGRERRETVEPARPAAQQEYRPIWHDVPFALMTNEVRRELHGFLVRLPVGIRDLYMRDTGWPDINAAVWKEGKVS